jgi:hydroxyacyl-ACP dehydratase HTD2-like protein with hotdog domain
MSTAPGTEIPERRHTCSHVQLFRFSAATWNAHRIHYDRDYAAIEGYPDVLVQSHLHGCLLLQAAMDWAGPFADLVEFSWENRGLAVPGDELVVTGRVVETSGARATVELESRKSDGTLVAPGRAVFDFDVEALDD